MERRQFLYGVLATGAAAIGTAAFGSTPAVGATGRSAASLSSTEQWLLGTGRRALS
jgi:hypothetical protein